MGMQDARRSVDVCSEQLDQGKADKTQLGFILLSLLP